MSADDIRIAHRLVGPAASPFIIAEMSGNHNGSLDRALDTVEAAAAAGAHALKLQTYTAETMTLDLHDGDFLIEDPSSLWSGKSLYQLYEEASTPWEWHPSIFETCRRLGLICFSTPFDPTAVDFLESLDVPAYKIASFENTDLALIRKVAATGKPIMLSCGMATLAELDETVKTLREAGCTQLVLLKCTSAYPASPETANLRTLPHLRDLFRVPVGLSDHTLGLGAALAAIALGASVIEKHFTLRRADGGVDAAFSLEPEELRALAKESHRAWQALGRIHYGPTDKEQTSLRFRRSLYVVKAMEADETFSVENVRSIRPGYGLAPKYLPMVMGKRAAKAIQRGSPLHWDLIG